MLAYTEQGTGTVRTVLLHGFLGSGRNLASLARAWQAADPERALLMPDLRGHGRSPAIEGLASLEMLADDVFGLLDALGWDEPVEVVGHSLGGRVGLLMLAQAPQRVRRLRLLDIAPGTVTRPETPAVLSRLLAMPNEAPSRAEMRRELLWEPVLDGPRADWLLMNLERRGDAFAWRIDRAALNRLFHRMVGRDLWSLLQSHGPRVQCIRGALSPYVTEADLEKFARAGCAATLTVASAGHFLQIDNPEGVLGALRTGAS